MRSGLLVLCCLGFAIPLAVYILIGANMRYSGDDYCYAANLAQHGFWDAQGFAYRQIDYYNGNRFSLNLFSALADLAGPYASGVLPGLAILIWSTGIGLAIQNAARLAGLSPSFLELALAAEALVYFTLALSPDIDQSLFWRSGMFPYLAPILASSCLAAMVLRQAGSARLPGWSASSAAVLAFLGAGFSETGGIVQAAWLGMVFLLLLGLYWRKRSARRGLIGVLALTAIAIFASLASLAVLALSPTVLLMKNRLAQPPALVEVLSLSMLFARRFLSTLKTAPLQNLLPVVVFAALTIHTQYRLPRLPRLKLVLTIAILFGLAAVTYVLIWSSMVPFSYIQQAYPEPRAEVIPRFIFTLAQAAAGCLLGMIALNLVRRVNLVRPAVLITGLALAACLASPLWTARVYWGELPRYQRWAQFWDRRDSVLRQSSRQGELDVHVMEIDHIIPRVGELSPQPDAWYNQCASIYYRLHTISADLPGWDE